MPPDPIVPCPVAEQTGAIIGIGAWVMIILIVVHVGAALYHHLVLHDGLIGRMTGR